MKVVLVEALHARPANVLVRVASRLAADVELRKGDARANAKSILEVLRLGARAGDAVEIVVTGSAAAEAEGILRALAERSFDPDLAPETGIAAVPGIAIGNALVVAFASEGRVAGTAEEERTRLRAAAEEAKRDVRALVSSLPSAEAQLFAPELSILDDLAAGIEARGFDGRTAEDAVEEATRDAPSDLVVEARARLLDALAGGGSTLSRALAGRDEPELVLVTDVLSPSIVAALPARVTGIVASGGGYASHAAILARSRELPLLYVEEHVTAGIVEGDVVVLDTTPPEPRLWVSPGEAVIAEKRAARASRITDIETSASLPPLDVALLVNVASVHDRVPAQAQGIGLVRTELLFATRRLAPPSAREQGALLVAIARKTAGPVVVRLFDAGGDKPLPWLADRGERGIELLFAYPEVLAAQLEAIAHARAQGDVRVLLPLARSADDVSRVRAALSTPIPVGAMIETVEAARTASAIAHAADFVCIGTNDLAASVLGVERKAAPALDARVLDVVRNIVSAVHACGKSVTVCGELAGDPIGARALVAIGVDALSMAPGRISAVRLALAAAGG